MKNRFSVAGVVAALAAVFSTPHASETEVVCGAPDQEVQPLSITYPPYPYSAMLFCIEGHARYEFTINPDGTTSNIKVIESEPEGAFEAAGDVIRFWTFEPRCRDGEPVERKATRKIEFQLDQVDSRNCPQNLPEELLDVQIALFSLYQRTDAAIRDQQAPLTPMAVDSALEEPFASMERAHRRHLNDLLELERDWRRYPLSGLTGSIRPSYLTTAARFSTSRIILDVFESNRHELYQRWPGMVMELRRELVEVSEMPGLTPEAYDLLLAGDLRQPEGRIEPDREMMALEASVFGEHRDLLDWLERHSHEWEVEDNRFRFASVGLEQAYERRMKAIRELWKTWDREFGTPRRIFWSGF